MREIVFIYWPDCARCHQIKPHVEKWASKNGYKFQEVQYADCGLEISSIPMMQVLDENGEQILDMDGIVNFISNYKQNE